jgi:hypothetical protein
VVAESVDGTRLLLGEATWSARPVGPTGLERALKELASRPPPDLPQRPAGRKVVRAAFVPELAGTAPERATEIEPLVVTAAELLR